MDNQLETSNGKVYKVDDYFVKHEDDSIFMIDKYGLFHYAKLFNMKELFNPLKLINNQQINNLNENESLIFPKKPLVINWLVASECTHNCTYCYAEDLMKLSEKMDDYTKTADKILKSEPLAVVLTGGDPFTNKNLLQIVDYLHDKTKVIIDTNGYLATDEHIDFLKNKNVIMRISIDDERPQVNEGLRPLKSKKDNIFGLNNAIETLNKCLINDIPVNIQTILTKKNINDFNSMAMKFSILGIKVWRIIPLNTSHIKESDKDRIIYTNLQRRDKILRQIQKFASKMEVLIDDDLCPSNSVILVSPNGDFYTEKSGIKVPATNENVNYQAHYNRYLRHKNIYIKEFEKVI